MDVAHAAQPAYAIACGESVHPASTTVPELLPLLPPLDPLLPPLELELPPLLLVAPLELPPLVLLVAPLEPPVDPLPEPLAPLDPPLLLPVGGIPVAGYPGGRVPPASGELRAGVVQQTCPTQSLDAVHDLGHDVSQTPLQQSSPALRSQSLD
jgi:hypothetical protein